MTHLVLCGLSHHTAPLAVRERVALSLDELPEALRALSARAGVREAAIVSTCNRSELYAVCDDVQAGRAAVESALMEIAQTRGGVAPEHVFRLEDVEVARHVFRVAASLEAMVLGEPQILGQVKDAYRAASDAKSIGPVLDHLFRRAIECGKRVRAETGIGAHAVSVSYAAVELAKKIFGPLGGRAALMIGAGETGELTARHLSAAGVRELWVANRTAARAQALAEALSARAVGLEALAGALERVDIVIASTGAAQPVLGRPEIERAMHRRRGRPLFVIDLGVPRDVAPEAGGVYNVFLYDLDDLGRVIADNRERRAHEAAEAGTIVEHEVERFERWFGSLEVVPTLKALRERAETLRNEETEKALERLSHLSAHDRELVARYGEALVSKVLHTPMTELRRAAPEESATLAGAARALFGLGAVTPADASEDESNPEPTG